MKGSDDSEGDRVTESRVTQGLLWTCSVVQPPSLDARGQRMLGRCLLWHHRGLHPDRKRSSFGCL